MRAASLGVLVAVGTLGWLAGCGPGPRPPAARERDVAEVPDAAPATDRPNPAATVEARTDAPDAAACQAACDNAAALVAAELAGLDEGGRSVLASTAGARGEKCLASCRSRGDRASVACVAQARTLIELAGCDGDPLKSR